MSLLHSEDVCASFYTLSGAPVMSPARFSLRARAEAAADAGLTGIGLSAQDYLRAIALNPVSEMHAILARTGVRLREVEFLHGWERGGGSERRWRYYEAKLIEMAHALDAVQLNIGILDPNEPKPGAVELAERFAGVCERAADAGLRVALEPIALSHFSRIAQADEIVQAAAAENGGILLDTYHFFRGGDSLDTLARIPPAHIVAIQLADAQGPRPSDLAAECVSRRVLPGDGDLPITELLLTLDKMGVDAPISVEVMSSRLQLLDVADVASRTVASVVLARKQALATADS